MDFLSFSSVVLLALTSNSYLPQWYSIWARGSSRGISITATCLYALAAQGQVANMWLLWKEAASGGPHDLPVANPPTFLDALNTVQIHMQWGCAVISLLLVVVYPPPARLTSEGYAVSRHSYLKNYAIAVLFLHIPFLLGIASWSTPIHDRILFSIWRDINNFGLQPAWTMLTVVAAILQVRLTRQQQELCVLNKWSLYFQAVLFLLLAITWPFRLDISHFSWENPSFQPAVFSEWYPRVGWACVNTAVLAAGQAVVIVADRVQEGAVRLQ